MHSDAKERTKLLKLEFNSLNKLANPSMHTLGVPNISADKLMALENRHELKNIYGRVNPNDKFKKIQAEKKFETEVISYVLPELDHDDIMKHMK